MKDGRHWILSSSWLTRKVFDKILCACDILRQLLVLATTVRGSKDFAKEDGGRGWKTTRNVKVSSGWLSQTLVANTWSAFPVPYPPCSNLIRSDNWMEGLTLRPWCVRV